MPLPAHPQALGVVGERLDVELPRLEGGALLGKAAKLAEKVANLRAFADVEGKMNLSVQDLGGSVLVVSQFTLYGDCQKGRRPSFTAAAPPDVAEPLYEAFVTALKLLGVPVATGKFAADMQVELVNDGPVTFVIEAPASTAPSP